MCDRVKFGEATVGVQAWGNGSRSGMEALGRKYIGKNESTEFSVWGWGQWKEVGEVYNNSKV